MHVFIALSSIILIGGASALQVECESKESEFSKHQTLDRINACLKSQLNPAKCVPKTQPEIVLNKIFQVLYSESFRIKKFQECSNMVRKHLPPQYIEVMHKHNEYSIGRRKYKCFTFEEICDDNIKFLYPFECFVKKYCDPVINNLGFAMFYAFQQISMESERPINCGGTDQFVLNPLVYANDTRLDHESILSPNFCDGVIIPDIHLNHEDVVAP